MVCYADSVVTVTPLFLKIGTSYSMLMEDYMILKPQFGDYINSGPGASR